MLLIIIMYKFIFNTTAQTRDCEAALKLDSRRIYKAFNMTLISTRTRQTLAKPFHYKLAGIQENSANLERKSIVVAQQLESFLNKLPAASCGKIKSQRLKNMRDNGILLFTLPLKLIKKDNTKALHECALFFLVIFNAAHNCLKQIQAIEFSRRSGKEH